MRRARSMSTNLVATWVRRRTLACWNVCPSSPTPTVRSMCSLWRQRVRLGLVARMPPGQHAKHCRGSSALTVALSPVSGVLVHRPSGTGAGDSTRCGIAAADLVAGTQQTEHTIVLIVGDDIEELASTHVGGSASTTTGCGTGSPGRTSSHRARAQSRHRCGRGD